MQQTARGITAVQGNPMSAAVAAAKVFLAEQQQRCRQLSTAGRSATQQEKMKKCNAVIGGEGNGGVIYPKSHYGRDAIVGIGLFLSLYAERGLKASELLETYPKYFMLKEKINLSNNLNVDKILNQIATKYKNEKLDLIDGVRIDFNESWVQLRKSNTESIIRIYSEAKSIDKAAELVNEIDDLVKEIIN